MAKEKEIDDFKKQDKGRVTLALAVTAFFAALGNSFNHGFNTGVINTPQKHVANFLNESFTAHFSPPNEGTLDMLSTAVVSIYLVGGCAGAFIAGFIADKFGRKKALILMAIPGVIADILFATCKVANSFEMLILARLIIGFSCGAGSGLVPMYLTEIAPVNIRGAMGVLHQLFLTCGILVSQALGLREALGSAALWPYLFAGSVVPFVLSCIVLPFYPDSPRWLLMKKGDEKLATEALQKFRGVTDVHDDIADMKKEIAEQQREPAWTMMQLFKSVPHRIPLMLVCVLAVCQQLSGINTVFYYSDRVFEGANIQESYKQYATLGLGAINVIMTIISVFLVEKAGRRPLLLGGMVIMILSLILLTIALALQHTAAWLSYLSVVATLIFVVGFAIGLGSIPQFIGAELFKQGPRPAAMSFAGLLNWIANFIVGISFVSIQAGLKEYCMIIFMVFLLVFGIIIWKYLPETKNKSFAEIAALLKVKVPEDDDREANVPLNDFSNGKNGHRRDGDTSPLNA